MCSKPFKPGGSAEFPCGQCMPCRLNRLRLWQGRLLLEAQAHPSSLFVTLTYSPEHLPHKGWLVPRDLQLFLKRLREERRRKHEGQIRFFAVGEYGEQTWRPHYHLALFGDFSQSVLADDGYLRVPVVQRSWKMGFAHVGELTHASAAYLVRYTLKRLVRDGDPLLEGRRPEFCRMSRNPGIGRVLLPEMVDALTAERKGAAFLAARGDVPTEFTTSAGTFSLGRYLTRELREELGRPVGQPASVSLRRSAERLSQDPSQRASVRLHHSRVAEQRVRNRKQKGDL